MVLGFAVIWGTLDIINLTHGDLLMLGAYIAFFSYSFAHINPLIVIPLAMASVFLLGYFMQRFIIHRVVGKHVLLSLLLTFGLSMVIRNVSLLSFTSNYRSVSPGWASNALVFAGGEIVIPYGRIAIFIASIVLLVGLFFFLKSTRMGRAIRAASQNKDGALIVGLNVSRIYTWTFAICAGIVGAAGVLVSMLISFNPEMGHPFTLRAFAITALGGLSVHGAFSGGMALGVIEFLVGRYVSSRLMAFTSFAIIFIVLATRGWLPELRRRIRGIFERFREV